MKVSWVSITVNIVLSIFKIAAGLVSGSGAMISDGVHSASDVFSTFVVIFGCNASQKGKRQGTPLWSWSAWNVAAIILASILAFCRAGDWDFRYPENHFRCSDGGLTVPRCFGVMGCGIFHCSQRMDVLVHAPCCKKKLIPAH